MVRTVMDTAEITVTSVTRAMAMWVMHTAATRMERTAITRATRTRITTQGPASCSR